jgi:hypothetical protein
VELELQQILRLLQLLTQAAVRVVRLGLQEMAAQELLL